MRFTGWGRGTGGLVGVLGVLAALVLVADVVSLPFIDTSSTPVVHAVTGGAAPKATTTTLARIGTYPLTGLPAYSTATLDRPALSVKVDNAPDARPQLGLNAADIVTEELVEGGLTRLFVTFQSRDAALVGPIRSARPEDTLLLRELGGGLFAFSGASAGVLADVQANSGATLLNPVAGDPTFERMPGRAAPANLFAATAALYHRGNSTLGPPPPLFGFSTQAQAGAVPTNTVQLLFSGSASAAWTWSGSVYTRTENGAADTLADGTPVTANNVVILSVGVSGSGNYDVLHHQTPVEDLLGEGTCWVLRGGVRVAGTWNRSSAGTPVTLSTTAGAPITLQPGRTWLELLPQPGSPAFS